MERPTQENDTSAFIINPDATPKKIQKQFMAFLSLKIKYCPTYDFAQLTRDLRQLAEITEQKQNKKLAKKPSHKKKLSQSLLKTVLLASHNEAIERRKLNTAPPEDGTTHYLPKNTAILE